MKKKEEKPKETTDVVVPEKSALTVRYELVRDKLTSVETALKNVLPSNIPTQKFLQIVFNSLRSSPSLIECVPVSIVSSVMTIAQLGLVTDGALGQAYLIPYNHKGSKICQVQIGYKGFVKLAYNTGKLNHIYSHVVNKGDHYEEYMGTDKKIIHYRTDESNEDELERIYAVVKFTNGMFDFTSLSKKQIDFVRDTLSAYPKLQEWQKKNSPWVKFYNSMGMKSVVKRLFAYAELSPEVVRAIHLDDMGEMGKQKLEGLRDADNIPDDLLLAEDDTNDAIFKELEEETKEEQKKELTKVGEDAVASLFGDKK